MSEEKITSLRGLELAAARRFLPAHLAKLDMLRLDGVHTPNYRLGLIVRVGRYEGIVVGIDHNRAEVTLAMVSE